MNKKQFKTLDEYQWYLQEKEKELMYNSIYLIGSMIICGSIILGVIMLNHYK